MKNYGYEMALLQQLQENRILHVRTEFDFGRTRIVNCKILSRFITKNRAYKTKWDW